jgi:hypothetical protein
MAESIRRGQLIYAAGVGGMTILRNGTSVICAGLDYWFHDSEAQYSHAVAKQSVVEDWRLLERLGVRELKAPPAQEEGFSRTGNVASAAVGVPFLRFPLWHVCPSCRRLSLETNRTGNPLSCQKCKAKHGMERRLVQVPLVAACEEGHLDDFPWTAWLKKCTCESPELRLRQRGGSGLGNFTVSCERCGARRSLAGAVTNASLGQCTGKRPWLLDGDDATCEHDLHGVLRNSTSTYFANVRTSVFIPKASEGVPEELTDAFDDKIVKMLIRTSVDKTDDELTDVLLREMPDIARRFGRSAVKAAVVMTRNGNTNTSLVVGEADYRSVEFNTLSKCGRHAQLRTNFIPAAEYDFGDVKGISGISLVDDLTVTKALTGFSRLIPSRGEITRASERMLWRSLPNASQRWLPATQVRGEGILIRLDEGLLRAWELRGNVLHRVEEVVRAAATSRFCSTDIGEVTPRLILLHTISHLVMRRLVFAAGYAAASLSERVYSRQASGGREPMAGVLIYTASGDADGSLGGLVRLGRPERFEAILMEAISSAAWCSNDPVCMELGSSGRQGPDGLNLAGCHACAHVPETACENFNVLLDRALVTGSLDDPTLGFFAR